MNLLKKVYYFLIFQVLLCFLVGLVALNFLPVCGDSSHGHSHEEHSHGDPHEGHSHEPPSFKYSREANTKEKPSVVERRLSSEIWFDAVASTLVVSFAPFLILFFVPLDNSRENQQFLKVSYFYWICIFHFYPNSYYNSITFIHF